MFQLLAATVPMDVEIALAADRPAYLLRARCATLPWIANNHEVADRFRQAVDTCLAAGDPAWRSPDAEYARLTEAIRQFLRKSELDIEPDLALTVELHDADAPAVKSGEETPWLKVRTYDDVVVANCEGLSLDDLKLHDAQVHFSPRPEDASTWLGVAPSRSFLVRSVRLRFKGSDVATTERATIVHTTTDRIDLPLLPARYYGAVRQGPDALAIVLALGNGQELVLPAKVTVADLTKPPVVLYLDLGSTYSKFSTVTLPAATFDETEDWRAAAVAAMNGVLSQVAMSTARLGGPSMNMWEPELTSMFVQTWSMPDFNKEKLDESDEDTVAAWITAAISAFAAGYARNGKHVVSAFWSFPVTAGRDLHRLQELVARSTTGVLLHPPTLVAEHESLRHRYRNVLSDMAGLAQAQDKARAAAIAENEKRNAEKKKADAAFTSKTKDYESSWFFTKPFKTKPTAPDPAQYAAQAVPSLEQWHTRFLRLNADPDLKDVLILDAGGYSLDVFCRLHGQAPYGKSFKAGGQDLTALVQHELARERGCTDPAEIPFSDAENYKFECCTPARAETEIGLALEIRTREVYAQALCEVLEWISAHGKKRGLPLIITGGAFNNVHLRKLLWAMLTERDINVWATDAVELSLQIEANQLLGTPSLRRFRDLTNGCKTGGRGGFNSYDILGGLIEAQLQGEARHA